MADLAKRVREHAAATLKPGEEVLATRLVAPRGSAGAQGGFGAIGMAVQAGVQARRRKKMEQEAQSSGQKLAHGLPDGRIYLTATNQRFLVHTISTMAGRPKELVAELPIDAVTGLEITGGAMVKKVVLHFADGSSRQIEMMRGGGSAEEFNEAIQSAKSGAQGASG